MQFEVHGYPFTFEKHTKYFKNYHRDCFTTL